MDLPKENWIESFSIPNDWFSFQCSPTRLLLLGLLNWGMSWSLSTKQCLNVLFTLEAIACFKIKLTKILPLLPRMCRREPWLLNILSYLLLSLVMSCQITSSFWPWYLFRCGWKHTIVTPLRVSHCTTFQRCACLNVFHLKLLKDFHNFFAYYARI